MGKNLSFKKIGKQILSINNLIESYFNKLRSFISNPKKFQFTRDNRVIFVFAGIVFLTLAYFLVPTAYNKDLIQKEIKNQLFLTYKIRIEFSDEINYGLFPKPHFVAKNLSILNDKKEIAVVNSLKVFIGFKNFFKFDQIKIKDLIFNKLEFNIKKSDLNFFSNILEAEPNRQKLIIKNSSIFFLDKDEEVGPENISEHRIITGEFNVYFGDGFTLPKDNDFRDWVISKGGDPDDAELALGYAPVADVIGQGTKIDFKEFNDFFQITFRGRKVQYDYRHNSDEFRRHLIRIWDQWSHDTGKDEEF